MQLKVYKGKGTEKVYRGSISGVYSTIANAHNAHSRGFFGSNSQHIHLASSYAVILFHTSTGPATGVKYLKNCCTATNLEGRRMGVLTGSKNITHSDPGSMTIKTGGLL